MIFRFLTKGMIHMMCVFSFYFLLEVDNSLIRINKMSIWYGINDDGTVRKLFPNF